MAGHSHWKQIKQQKSKADQKRGQVFSKILNAISIAARSEPNPDFNPRLRALIEKAKASKMPQENIDRAVNKASENKNLEEVTIEAYGPESAAIIIEGITDNKNRTIAEIRHLLSENDAKMAEVGGVLWAFEKTADGWQAKFPQLISETGKQKLQKLVKILEEQDDVQKVITNVN
jgi:YebC/PmpR family DNA-binding regulatory protein